MKNTKMKYDFAGYVTHKDVLCSDGVVIKHGAFESSKTRVPLVWNHNYSEPGNVIGYTDLHHVDGSVYGYSKLNNTQKAKDAKQALIHGDINSYSIGANRIVKNGNDVVSGNIYEVSLVLTGANPKAVITEILTHNGDASDSIILDTDHHIHMGDEIITFEEEKIKMSENYEELLHSLSVTEDELEELFDSLSEEEQAQLLENLAEMLEEDEDLYDEFDDYEDDEELSPTDKKIVKHMEEIMKQNIFDAETKDSVLTHDDTLLGEVLQQNGGVIKSVLQHSAEKYGVEKVEELFPDPQLSKMPYTLNTLNLAAERIFNGVHKVPFARLKSMYFDITKQEARARGYLKGKRKYEQLLSVLKRVTHPSTIYVKQRIDRDDVVDAENKFALMEYLEKVMTDKLKEEIARAIMIGDGRESTDADKINEESIRPIVKEDDVYVIKKTADNLEAVIPTIWDALVEYRGSGTPTMFADPRLINKLRNMRLDNKAFFLTTPTLENLASVLGVAEVVPTAFLDDDMIVLVNLSDYHLGGANGGQVASFRDFDIDFNQHKMLKEVRLSGALVIPDSAVIINVTGEPKNPMTTAPSGRTKED